MIPTHGARFSGAAADRPARRSRSRAPSVCDEPSARGARARVSPRVAPGYDRSKCNVKLREDAMRLGRMLLVLIVALTFGSVRTQAAEPVKIRLAWVIPLTNWGSLLFEKNDVMRHYGRSYTVETVRFQGTPPMITALAAGELDIADLAYSSFALAIQNAGMDDLRVIADETQDGVEGYYTGPFVVLRDGPVKKIADLKGKVVASVGAGAAVDIAMRAVLRKHGLEDKRDYSVVEAGFPNMRAMLTDKKVDLVPAALPFGLDPEFVKVAANLFTIKDAFGGPTELVVWAARQNFLSTNRAALVDFMEDCVRAVHFLVDPKNRTEVIEIAARVSKQPPALLDSYLFTKKDLYHDPDMVPDLDSLQRAVDIQRELGFLKSRVDVKSHADLSIVHEAGRRLK
jgi:NitT/TauT family transport system substrate-binding protein